MKAVLLDTHAFAMILTDDPRLPQAARGDGFKLLPLTASAALASFVLPWRRRNPLDRIIAAVAQEEALPLVSSDVAFDGVTTSRIWAEAVV
ncbi:type II toxin-antitoxin system VapC family toxin (plasmid) [Rhodobacteraceae bacterium SC52]|nr:type II toxin-antitoxin system VapC family toxin [Rhodobacteraceae bacterium SC52]